MSGGGRQGPGPSSRRLEILRAALAAAVLSGAPSTAWSLATGADVLAAARAAGTLLPGRRHGRGGLVAGLAAHAVLSVLWTAVLAALLPRRGRLAGAVSGAAAGLAIAAVDLGWAGSRFPAVRALPAGPQWADHVAFGAVAGALLAAPPGP